MEVEVEGEKPFGLGTRTYLLCEPYLAALPYVFLGHEAAKHVKPKRGVKGLICLP